MVRYLVENGANVNATTNLGYTPLHQASQQGRVLIIDLLLGAGAQPNATTNVSSFIVDCLRFGSTK